MRFGWTAWLILFANLFTYGIYCQDQQSKNQLLQTQVELMEVVRRFDQKVPLSRFMESLANIQLLSAKIKNRSRVQAFYHELLRFAKYKKLYSILYYYISENCEIEEKEKYLLKSLKFSQSPQEEQACLYHLYGYYRSRGMKQLQLSTLLRLINSQEINRNLSGLETSYYHLGQYYRGNGHFLTALNYYFKGLEILAPPDSNIKGKMMLAIAQVFGVMNRIELAKKYLKRALDYAIYHRKQELKILILSAYSQIFFQEKDNQNALRYINLSIRAAQKLIKPVQLIGLYYQKSIVLLKANQVTEAMVLLESAIKIAFKFEKYENLLPVLGEYVENLIQLKQFSDAENYLHKIDDIYASYYPYYFFYFYLKALFYEGKGDMMNALKFYQKTASKLEQYFSGLNDERYSVFNSKIEEIYSRTIEYYLKMFGRTNDTGYLIQALYFCEIRNSCVYEWIVLKSHKYSHLVKEKKKVERELLFYNKNYLQVLNTEPDIHTIQFFEHKLKSLRSQLTELEELILEIPLRFKRRKFEDLNFATIQKKLHSGQLILRYAMLEHKSFVFVISCNRISFLEIGTGSDIIRNLVQKLTEPLDDFTKGKVDYLRINYNLELADKLYQILIHEILKAHPETKELFVIPDRALFKLPFEALVTGYIDTGINPDIVFSEYATANYLIEKCQISYSLSLFHFQEDIPPLKQQKYLITAFGNPKITEDKKNDIKRIQVNSHFFRQIPSSAKEIHAIKDIFTKQKSKILLAEHFNQSNFEKYAPLANIIHVATHFFNNFDYPQHSALLFSPSQQTSPFYYAHQVFALKLTADLVFLSACESSEKNLQGVQGLRGMTAAFRHAGVNKMIVSMWPVDEQSSELIPLFYRQYAISKNAPESLHHAKLQLMKTVTSVGSLRISLSHPFLWANFIILIFNK